MTKTLVFVLLDSSSSMRGDADQVVIGFNELVAEQRLVATDEGRLCLITFDTDINTVYVPTRMVEAPALTEQTYKPRSKTGKTGLFRAIDRAITIADNEDTDERVMIVVVTTGADYGSLDTVNVPTHEQHMIPIIKDRMDRHNWSFVYVGEAPDTWCEPIRWPNSLPSYPQSPRQSIAMISDGMTTFRSTESPKTVNFFDANLSG